MQAMMVHMWDKLFNSGAAPEPQAGNEEEFEEEEDTVGAGAERH